ncbi:conserved oligomeric Golgi complex subunit 1 [Myzus persicae]|uniref:conserved oligomeric Golgi complex subunit 1 n=1 Tax=Myzus persicae TaxID=13164 RepID=UPI000B9325AB|nr:conserved oligomeric Golgi complex subunit 1 [Myzus persicae]
MDTKFPTKNANEFANDLFETCNLTEIESLQSSLKKDVEKKADQLKSLVSEKYRDLIDAADTISSMAIIVSDITNVTEHILKTNQTNSNTTLDSKDNLLDKFAAQSKLLIDLTEQIWDCLNSRNYLTATQLFLLASCIKTSLNEDLTKGLKKGKPFLDRVWSTISHFQTTISDKTRLELSSHISPEKAACCFISLSILEKLDAHSLVKEFIILRSNMLQHSLTEGSSVEKNIENSCNLIINTIYNLYLCFTNYDLYNSGMIYLQIKKNLSNRPNVLSLVDLDYSLKFGLIYIPNSIKEFKIDCTLTPNELSQEYITNIVTNWLVWAKPFVCTKVTEILQSVQSFSTLHHLNQLSTDYPQHWTAISEQISFESDLWSELYCPLFAQRTKELLTSHWEDVFPVIISDIDEALLQPEEPHLQDSLFSDTDECFETRSIGCSDRTAALCACVERRISLLVDMLSELYSEDEDPWALRQHQGSCCNNFIIRLGKSMVQLVEQDTLTEPGVLLIARFLWFLPVLCTTLKQCLVSLYQQFNFWTLSKEEIQNSSIIVWNKWIELVTKRMFDGLKGNIFPITLGEQLSTIPKWDILDIEVEKESGELVVSKLQVPNQPTFPLQNFIHDMIRCLALTLPPKFVQEKTIALCTEWILIEYRNNSELETSLKSRHQIQKLFDLKYINQLFIGIENQNLSVICSEQISAVENQIDPINLDILDEYIVKNVKRAVVATKCIFGTMYPGQFLQSECSDEANNLMFSTYRFKLFLVTDS